MRKWRKTPFYKVQFYNSNIKAWQDKKRTFDTIEQAQTYITTELESHQVRIIVVERNRRYILESQDKNILLND